MCGSTHTWGQEAQVSGGAATGATSVSLEGKRPTCEGAQVGVRRRGGESHLAGADKGAQVRMRIMGQGVRPTDSDRWAFRWVVGCLVVRKQAYRAIPGSGGAVWASTITAGGALLSPKAHHLEERKCGFTGEIGGWRRPKSGKIAVNPGITFGDICAPVNMTGRAGLAVVSREWELPPGF